MNSVNTFSYTDGSSTGVYEKMSGFGSSHSLELFGVSATRSPLSSQ